MRSRKLITGAVLLGLAGAMSACASGGDSGEASPTIVVGSAAFPENVTIAELYAQALEAKGFTVETTMNITTRDIRAPLLESGEITVTPEYSGALLGFFDKNTTLVGASDIVGALPAALPAGTSVLEPSSAQNRAALVVLESTAREFTLTTMEDLAKVSDQLVLGAAAGTEEHAQGIPGFNRVYGIEFKEFKPLDLSGPITRAALDNGDIDVAYLFTTDPSILAQGYVVLEDPLNVFSSQEVIPWINDGGSVTAEAREVLNLVSAALTTEDLQAMNIKVVLDKEDSKSVAKEWLESKGLLAN